MNRCNLIIFFTLISLTIHGQKQGNIWYFGEGVGLDFNDSIPSVIYGGQIFGNPQNDLEFLYSEGCSSIADSTGSPLFYSNGEKVWNRNHEVMPNGSGLMGMYSSTHAAFIVPQPGSDSLFYIFTTDGLERNLEDGLRYHRVNMCLDDGLGDVIVNQKNLLLLPLVSEKLTAITHENGEDIWLIAHAFNSDDFHAFLITSEGIETSIISSVGSIHQGNGFYSAIGQMKASQDGNRIALVFSNVLPSVTEVFDFDKSTGLLSNPLSLTTHSNEYGVEFSPDNTKLYISSLGGLHQFDLSAGTGSEADVNATRALIPQPYFCIPSGLQLGPNGKIYVNRCSSFIGVINNPNAAAETCEFVDEIIDFGSDINTITFPSFMPFSEYKNEVSQCESILTVEEIDVTSSFSIFPNPATEMVEINFKNDINEEHDLFVYDVSGKVVLQKTIVDIDQGYFSVESLRSGLYFVKLNSKNMSYNPLKILVQ